MAGSTVGAGDVLVGRLTKELEDKSILVNGIFERANLGQRDINADESLMVTECRSRMEAIQGQLSEIQDVNRVAFETRSMAHTVDEAINQWKGRDPEVEVEYRSGGAYILDIWQSHNGDRDATQRLDTYYRSAAHQRTGDNLGIIPDPVIGPVINFIDAARPLVSLLNPQPLTQATWHRPIVTQHTSVAAQGAAGAAADEKSELTSQKMVIGRLTANAVTYGGYVNVSRQNIDFSSPQALDLIVNDLAAQYAIETEAVTGAALAAVATTAIGYGGTATAVTVAKAVWQAAGQVYAACKGQGRLILVCAPDVLGTFGPLFPPVNPQTSYSQGLSANQFGQGAQGGIAGVNLAMSAGLTSGEAFVLSTSAIEVYEQRVGTLQAVEPSVAGLQVAYMGYFTPLTINAAGIIPLTAT